MLYQGNAASRATKPVAETVLPKEGPSAPTAKALPSYQGLTPSDPSSAPDAQGARDASASMVSPDAPRESPWARYLLLIARGHGKERAIELAGLGSYELATCRQDPVAHALEQSALRAGLLGGAGTQLGKAIAQANDASMVVEAMAASRDPDALDAARLGNRRLVLERAGAIGQGAQAPVTIQFTASQVAILVQQLDAQQLTALVSPAPALPAPTAPTHEAHT